MHSSRNTFLSKIETAYAGLRLLSIDVALAALGGGVMAVRSFGISPRLAFYFLLPLGAFAVYTLDHLLDAFRMGESAATPRHQFHRRHFIILSLLCGMTMIASAVLAICDLSWTGLYFGLAIGAFCCLHELLVKLVGDRASPLLMKELGVAIVFTAGTWGLPGVLYVKTTHHLFHPAWILCLQYFLLALTNLIEFSYFEYEHDVAAGQTSFVRGVGVSAARRTIFSLIAVSFMLEISMSCLNSPIIRSAEMVQFAMNAGLATLVFFPKSFVHHERYRVLGDGVFMLPLLMAIL